MKKKIVAGLMAVVVVSSLLVGCGSNFAAKNLGGDMTVNLEPNQKLINATWKDDNLWYLTRPMKEGEEAEVLTFQQKSEFGVFEGTVTFVESGK